jgi:putative oxidoreductase
MRIVVTIARILLGLVFFVLGLNGFIGFLGGPPTEGTAGAFLCSMAASHYQWFTSGVQVLAGLMLLTDMYVPLAIVALAAVLANILPFHITMMPAGLPLPIIVTILWFIVAWPLRAHFAPIFVRKVPADRSSLAQQSQ